MADSFLSSLTAWWKEKTNSPLYFTFILFFIAWNWKAFQIVFLESASLFNAPRIEYLKQYDIHIQLGHIYPWSLAILNGFLNEFWRIIPPIIFTLVSIRYLPYIQAWAHNIHLDNYFSRKEAYDLALVEYERKKTQNIRELKDEKIQQRTEERELKEALTEEERWEVEYNLAALNPANIDAIKVAFNIVYKDRGRFTTNQMSQTDSVPFIKPDILARLDGLGIVVLDTQSLTMQLLPKGKFFIKKTQEMGLI